MSRPASVLRRYTPPTCTLEVIAKDSPLSRWAAQPVVKNVRFQLSLDDPTRPQEQWAVIRGDRTQLADLCEAVSDYVQHLLDLPETALTISSASPGSVATLPTIEARTTAPPANTTGIVLAPKGLLKHELYWGTLANDEAGSVTTLNTLQLFDLANALDEYSIDVLDLPTLERSGWLTTVPNWAQIAAIVLVAVGLSTSAIKLLDGSQGGSLLTANNPSQGASSSDQQIATQIPPSIVEKATPPVISTQKLPPPSPGATPPTVPGAPKVTQPSPTPTSSPATLPPGAIATYPVPVSPGRPTIITGEAEPSTQAAAPAQPNAAASAASESLTADAAAQLNAQTFSRQRTAKESGSGGAAGSTAFDTIPQVAEVRNYFQQRWQPPEGLNQTLEYSLQLDANGTLKSITPLKQASGDYLDRTGMPLLGDPFVSPLKGRDSAKVRLVLDANGQVKAFLED